MMCRFCMKEMMIQIFELINSRCGDIEARLDVQLIELIRIMERMNDRRM